MYKVGDRVNVYDGSWSFGIYNGKYCGCMPHKPFEIRQNLLVIETNLSVMENANGGRQGQYSEICDLLITDEGGNFWFIRSEFCKSANKEIEIRYFADGKDVTNKISNKTKRNLRG